MREKLRNFLIKLLGGTTAGELEKIRHGYIIQISRLHGTIMAMKSLTTTVCAEVAYRWPPDHEPIEGIRSEMMDCLATAMGKELLQHMEIRERKEAGPDLDNHYITGQLRIYKED